MKKHLFRFYKYLLPYKHFAALNFLFQLFTIIFSLFSLGMIVPFLNLIFGVEQLILEEPVFSFSKDGILSYLAYLMSRLIVLHGQANVLILISIAIIVLFFLRNSFRYLAMWILAPLRNGVIKDIRNDIYKKILILPISYFSEKKKGDVISRATSDVTDIEWTIMGSIEMLFRDTLTIIAFMGTLFWYNAELTFIMICVIPLAGFAIAKIGKSLRRKSTKAQSMMGSLMSSYEEAISGLRIIKAFNAISFSERKFKESNDEYTEVMQGVFRRGDLSAPLSEFFGIIVMSVVLWYGGNMILNHNSSMDGPGFIFYIVLFSQVIPAIKSLSSGYYRLIKGTASAQRVWELLDADEAIIEKPDALEINSFEKSIEYKSVNFKYGLEPVLDSVDLIIKKGKTIAIVGPSGAGKSTLVDLLPRFYDIISGSLQIDGKEVKDLRIDHLRALMGIVTQESILFNDTVFNNIAFGLKSAKEEDVIAAAKVANAHEFIEKMPDGYLTFIGDRGNKLSGGQRQRISIARAVLKNPPIMILDEATSALDTESERLVQQAIENLMRNRTSVVIAHRLSTIQNADEIVVMVSGKIIQRGPHRELINQEGMYKRLHDMQSFV